jgi:hypothetical protein
MLQFTPRELMSGFPRARQFRGAAQHDQALENAMVAHNIDVRILSWEHVPEVSSVLTGYTPAHKLCAC